MTLKKMCSVYNSFYLDKNKAINQEDWILFRISLSNVYEYTYFFDWKSYRYSKKKMDFLDSPSESIHHFYAYL